MFKKHSREFFLKYFRQLPVGVDGQFMVSGEGKIKTVPGCRLRLWELIWVKWTRPRSSYWLYAVQI